MHHTRPIPLGGFAAVLMTTLSLCVQAQLADITQPGDPIIPTSNNSPGSEGAANAIDNQPTKYLNFDELNTGFTVTPSVGLSIVSGLTLTSANDAPERDPASYILAGSYDGVSFTPFASGTVPAFPSRYFKNTILFANQVPYLHYRLIFPTVADAGAANSMQISEVELLGELAPMDVTVPGDPIVATSNNSPGSEGPANAIDDQPTKYLNFDKLNTGFTVTPSVGDTIVIGLTLTSANDAPERDPASYTLEGAKDGTTFAAISSGTVPSFPSRYHKNYLFFTDNAESYKSYRLIFPTVADAAAANSMQISEVEFLGVTPGTVNTNVVDTLIRRQPQDTPVLLGSTATFRMGLTGPWEVQWYRDGAPIPGANAATYTTAAATQEDDGALFKAVVQSPRGTQTSDEVMLSIFTPSSTVSFGVNWVGEGANGAPTEMLLDDITGYHRQAYWNNLDAGSGSLTGPTNSNNQFGLASPITVTWATSGEWGAGTGEGDPTERMLNGMGTIHSTASNDAQTVTISGVPSGTHSLLLYTVQVPLEFFNMNFIVETYNGDGSVKVTQNRFIRPQNADEYNPLPGYVLVTAETAAERGVGNMMRFDNLQTDNGTIQIKGWSPGRAQPPGAEPIRGPGLNAFQLLVSPPPVGAPPVITAQPVSVNGILGGQVTLSVEATGPNLAYQWLKDGQSIPGATDPRLTLSNLATNDAASYVVAISNPAGRIVSRKVVVEVLESIQITEGLINYFRFDDNDIDAIAANDVPGKQAGGVRGIFPTHDDPGLIGKSLILSKVDGIYVFVTNSTKVSDAMTISGWISSADGLWGADTGQGAPIINTWMEDQTIGNNGQFKLEVVPGTGVTNLNGTIEVGPNKFLASGPIDASFDEFIPIYHHFAMTANGLTLSVYWDGVLAGSVDYLGAINAGPFPWLSIGAILSTNSAGGSPLDPPVVTTFNGRIDDVAMWSRSLSADEISAIYVSGLTGVGVGEVPPALTPPVEIMRMPGGVIVAWDPALTGWVLESTPSLEAPVWTDVPGVANNSVFIPDPTGNAFFRLRKQ